jgi:hypothetical protein
MMRSLNPHPASRDPTDPFSAKLRPPPGESPAARDVRLIDESESRRMSNRIDEQLRVSLLSPSSHSHLIPLFSLFSRLNGSRPGGERPPAKK